MSQLGLEKWVDSIVSVITTDGRCLVGIFQGFDQVTNIVIEQAHERIYRPTEPVEKVQLGNFIIRGDTVACIGLVDLDKDILLDFESMRGEKLRPIVH